MVRPSRVCHCVLVTVYHSENEYPREEWIDQGQPQGAEGGEDADPKDREQLTKSVEEEKMDKGGDYVNYEVTLAYAARPGQKVAQHNMHLLLAFYIGMADWTHIPISESFSETQVEAWQTYKCYRNLGAGRILFGHSASSNAIRAAASLHPKSDFYSHGCSLGECQRTASRQVCTVHSQGRCTPTKDDSRHFPNVLDLPLISGFVKSSIAAAASEYVAPKSMTMNMAQMLAGGGVKKDTKALGVIAVTIHHASGLSSQDSNGKSDPYIVLAYAKFGKPLYSSRIIEEERGLFACAHEASKTLTHFLPSQPCLGRDRFPTSYRRRSKRWRRAGSHSLG